jgi:hypothetical protein
MNQNVYFEVCRQVETTNNVYNYIIFVFKNGSIYLFRAALCKLIFVLYYNALFRPSLMPVIVY